MRYVRTLHDAAIELVSNLTLKQRLVNAYSKHLKNLDGAELPAAIVSDWSSLKRDLTCQRPATGESAVQATVRKLSASELESLAARILSLYQDAASLGTLRVVEDPRRDIPQEPAVNPVQEAAVFGFLSRA